MKQSKFFIYLTLICIIIGAALIINAFLNLPDLNFNYFFIKGVSGLTLVLIGNYLFKKIE